MCNCKSLFKQILPQEKTKNLPKMTTSFLTDRFIKVLYKTTLPKTATFEWHQSKTTKQDYMLFYKQHFYKEHSSSFDSKS